LADSVLGLAFAFLAELLVCAHFYSPPASFLWLVPAGIYFGMIAVQLIHNCAHRSFRPAWINRPLGELLAIHLLSGFPGFVILHLSHHQHADHPELDPHPNGDLGFWEYFFSIKRKLKGFFRATYFRQWGQESGAARSWTSTQRLLRLNRFLRASLLLLVAGPVVFTLFFLPSFLANHLTFAHINYFTHQKQPDGSVKIVNLHSGAYRLLNILMLGGYSHRNHHDAPQVFNPSRRPETP
jgi:fatty acid desaturase